MSGTAKGRVVAVTADVDLGQQRVQALGNTAELNGAERILVVDNRQARDVALEARHEREADAAAALFTFSFEKPFIVRLVTKGGLAATTP